ncbi:hypothetical protein AMEX_G4556 [Astyanax mexicanus]|uniref:Uncharacterized protein n=1 Tax=Astyanax mexicanus TaxID=7994 RepID=A0A8T2MC04_ASTMX|nr:hypothetical protein AMEX_G4556 [Astyanax mexicanus]
MCFKAEGKYEQETKSCIRCSSPIYKSLRAMNSFHHLCPQDSEDLTGVNLYSPSYSPTVPRREQKLISKPQ